MTDVTFRLAEDRERLDALGHAWASYTYDRFIGADPDTCASDVVNLARAALEALEVEVPGRVRTPTGFFLYFAASACENADMQPEATLHEVSAAVLRALLGEEGE